MRTDRQTDGRKDGRNITELIVAFTILRLRLKKVHARYEVSTFSQTRWSPLRAVFHLRAYLPCKYYYRVSGLEIFVWTVSGSSYRHVLS